MTVYPIVVVNDPNCTETTYIIGVYSSEQNAAAQILTWAGARTAVTMTDYEKEEWGTRYYFYDSSFNQGFYADVEKAELDEQAIFL